MSERISDEKQWLAQESYDLLDAHIRRLDDDAKRIDADYIRRGLMLPPPKRQRRVSPEDVAEMPVDPNEPLYCTCRRIAFGQMVGCDQPGCETEWFHFGCVGVTRQPTGAWICPGCTQKTRRAQEK
ncbi:unnamed protein product, partial [Phaeothamnion confervicola]